MARYERFEIENIESLPEIIRAYPELRGLNVTLPFKQQIISYLDDLSPEAAAIGAVNCILVRDGKLTGYNTDSLGFRASLLPLLGAPHDRALVLGTGGSSRAVHHALQGLGITSRSVSRRKGAHTLTYQELSPELVKAHKIIINTTPLGMYPRTEELPDIPYDAITPEHVLYDLIYNPEETRFLQEGRARGATTKNGLEMLQLQAEASWELWNQPTV